MASVTSLALLIGAAFVAVPVTMFVVEVIAALFSARRAEPRKKFAIRHPRVAVLVPAHNESTGLRPTLHDVKEQLRPGDRVVVVADNCNDDTAATALACGAEVIERHDPARRGKAYALDFGLRHLSANPPEVVIMLDADCRLAAQALEQLAQTCATSHRPVQALYLMSAPAQSQINQQVAEFAWRVKNWLRPLGLRALRLPCQLTGSGMAFPWEVVWAVDHAHGSIVEDLKLGLDLAANGTPPQFCPSARVTSEFASAAGATRTQRQRWEGGHIGMIVSTFPKLLFKTVVTRDWHLLAMALDLAVPPLSLLAFLVIAMFAVTAIFALFGLATAAFAVSAVTLLAFMLSAGLAWFKCGRDVVPARSILLIPRYVFAKFGLYRGLLLTKTDPAWIRTDRAKSE